MIEPLFFRTHICKWNMWNRRSLEIFNRFIHKFNFTPKSVQFFLHKITYKVPGNFFAIECPKMKLYTFLLIPTKKVDYNNIKHISIKIKKVKTGLEISDFRTALGITHAIVIIGQ
jgi:hypothetical protein